MKFHASDAQGTFDYLAGMQVSPDAALPPELARVRLPACRFAVFLHHGHVSQLHETVRDAFGSWLPYSGHAARSDDGMPEFLEVYTEAFEPTAGRGGMEVWVPLAD